MMLTSDLVRTTTRKGVVRPLYIDPKDKELGAGAQRIIDIFRSHLGLTKGELDDALDELYGYRSDFLLWRGLVKLLSDRCEFEISVPHKPAEIRSVVFALAAQVPIIQTNVEERRRDILNEAANQLKIDIDTCEKALYADIEQRLIMQSFKEFSNSELLARYNVALVQAVLYHATGLTISIIDDNPRTLRSLFHALKFYRLMYRSYKLEDGYKLYIDGPASLLSSSRKYGIQMAMFFPMLLHIKRWDLSADLIWGKKKESRVFYADDKLGLRSHYKLKAQWISQEEKWLEERFEKLDTDWKLVRCARIIELPDNEVMVPEYTLRSPSGDVVNVDIVGFWRLEYLKRRIDLLRDTSIEPFVLVVSERLKSDREKLLESPSEVVFFKGVILPDKLIQAAQKVIEMRQSQR